jgi:hypothetical protein
VCLNSGWTCFTSCSLLPRLPGCVLGSPTSELPQRTSSQVELNGGVLAGFGSSASNRQQLLHLLDYLELFRRGHLLHPLPVRMGSPADEPIATE